MTKASLPKTSTNTTATVAPATILICIESSYTKTNINKRYNSSVHCPLSLCGNSEETHRK